MSVTQEAFHAVIKLAGELGREKDRVRYWRDKAVEQAAKLVTVQRDNNTLRSQRANLQRRTEELEARTAASEEGCQRLVAALARKERECSFLTDRVRKLDEEVQDHYRTFCLPPMSYSSVKEPGWPAIIHKVRFEFPYLTYAMPLAQANHLSREHAARRIVAELSTTFQECMRERVRKELGLNP